MALLLCCLSPPSAHLTLSALVRTHWAPVLRIQQSLHLLGSAQNPNPPPYSSTVLSRDACGRPHPPPPADASHPALLGLHTSREALFNRGSLGLTGSASGGHGFWPSGPAGCSSQYIPAPLHQHPVTLRAHFRVFGTVSQTSFLVTWPRHSPNRCLESTEVWWVGQEGRTRLLLRKQL